MITTLEGLVLPKETAVAIGFFDGFHLGHQAVIAAAGGYQKEGLALCVFSYRVDDTLPDGPKGHDILVTEKEKERLCGGLSVRYLIEPPFCEFQGKSPLEFAKEVLHDQLKARAVSCGFNLHFGKNAAGSRSDLLVFGKELGFSVDIVPAVELLGEPVSSTRIRGALQQGKMELANAMLGRIYSYISPVVHGERLGHTIGFPTVNQYFAPRQTVPRYGIYASLVWIDGQVYVGATNIGVRPTIKGEKKPNSETYILHYSGDLYGKEVRVGLIEYLRPEKKFDSLKELTDQIGKDATQAEKIGVPFLKNSPLY